MKDRIDLLVGSIRAAELVNAYRRRLIQQDCLPDRAALRLACEAYADGCVYVIVAPGQIWQTIGTATPPGAVPERLSVVSVGVDGAVGHCAVLRSPCGTEERIPLDRLAAGYDLTHWPQPAESDGDNGSNGQ